MALTVVPMRRNSPLTGWPSISSAIFCVRSPSATAISTRATSVVGCTRSAISALMEWTDVFQEPATSPNEARSAIRPSRPTTRSRRTISVVSASLRETTWLKARAISAIRPVPRVKGRRTSKSPCCAAVSASRSWRRRTSSLPPPPPSPLSPSPPPRPPRLRLRSDSFTGSCISPTCHPSSKSADSKSADTPPNAAADPLPVRIRVQQRTGKSVPACKICGPLDSFRLSTCSAMCARRAAHSNRHVLRAALPPAARSARSQHEKAFRVLARQVPGLPKQAQHLAFLLGEQPVGAAHLSAALEGELALCRIDDGGGGLAHAGLEALFGQLAADRDVDVAGDGFAELRQVRRELVDGEGLAPFEAPVR